MAILATALGWVATVVRLSFSERGDLALFETGNVVRLVTRYSLVISAVLLVLTGSVRVLLIGIRSFGRWFFTWRIIKQVCLGTAIALGLVVLLYLEEDWRGWKAWEACRRECEAKGLHLDFAHFIPAPVPDDQNFAMAPVVASTWAGSLDRNGHVLIPPDTNVVNRLDLSLERAQITTKSNMHLQRWRYAQAVDLRAWQNYFRQMWVTNEESQISYSSNSPSIVTNVTVVALTTNEFPMAPQPQTPAEDVMLALSRYGPVLDELRQASQRPYARFPLNYTTEEVWNIALPHLGAMVRCGQVLGLRAVAELERGSSDQALSDVELILYLSDSLRDEPCLADLGYRMRVLNCCFQPIWEGLASRRWSEAQLRVLEQELSRIDGLREYDLGVQAGLAATLKQIDYLRKSRWKEWVQCLCGDRLFWPTLQYRLSPDGWFYMDARAVTWTYNEARPTDSETKHRVLSPQTERRVDLAWLGERTHVMGPHDIILSVIAVPQGRAILRWAETQAFVDMARIACALERYRRIHQEYPESLQMLAPDLVDRVPNDIVTGQPLHYAHSNNGRYILYSVGWNEKDDRGVPTPVLPPFLPDPSQHPGDWVWRYPEP